MPPLRFRRRAEHPRFPRRQLEQRGDLALVLVAFWGRGFEHRDGAAEDARVHRLGAGRIASRGVFSPDERIDSTCARGIQTCVELSDEDIPLPEMSKQMLGYWAEELGESRMVATFLPPDLRELPEYVRYKAKDKPSKSVRERMLRALEQRIDWEIVREYGMGVVVGRSLDRTGCSTLAVDESRIQRAAEKLLLYIEEEQPVALHGDCDRQLVQHFLEGVVLRLRLRGGILHPLLERYVKRGSASSCRNAAIR